MDVQNVVNGIVEKISKENEAIKEELSLCYGTLESRERNIESILAENLRLKAEVDHWKSNHDNMVNRSRILMDRLDLPLERVKAFEQLETLRVENEKLRKALKKIADLDPETDTDEGYNEWGEAACFVIAKDVANAAMTTPDTKGE